MMSRFTPLAAAVAVVFTGCATVHHAANEVGNTASDVAAEVTAPHATATLRDASGATVGTAGFAQQDNSVRIEVKVNGLPAGTHGVHLHEVGTCTPPDFASAGGHFNPMQKHHGLSNPAGPHAGDMPNLTVGADGNGDLEISDDRITLNDGPNSLFDANGTAIVVHAGPDDQMSDPSGNSGARIACGVVTKG
jgi:Cu-Zn family superoxide dismutase